MTSPLPQIAKLLSSLGQQDDTFVKVDTTWAVSNILTVGVGKEFSTIAAAVAHAQSGSIIEVSAGTYTNDFATVTSNITMIGVGGIVNMVATVPPANLKGIITVDASCTIENFSFSGAAIDDADGGNGAGIRYEGGAMVLTNDSFQNNQDGLLAFPVLGLPINTIVLNNDTFNQNGSGTGYTHNAYIGAVDSLTVTNCIFEQANVGHELKSRALVNTIKGNLFYDGNATASYDIDLPNGGTDVVANNTIEKGPSAENDAMIHFSGEGIPYSGSSLLVQGNSFIDDQGDAIGVLNQSAISVTIKGNSFANMVVSQVASGPAVETGNTNGSGVAFTNTTLTALGSGTTQFYTDALPHTIVLNGSIQAVEGGAGLLTVTATAGHIIAIGGSGGMDYTEAASSGGNSITTAANSTNIIVLAGQDTLDSEGNDTITAGTGNITAAINGKATIKDSTETGQWSVNGTAVITAKNSNEFIGLGSAGNVTITGTEYYLQINSNGGKASFNVTQGGGHQQGTISGGSANIEIYSDQMQIVTGGGAQGATMTFAAGTVNLTSVGNDVIHVGAATATVVVSGAAQVYAGTGQLSVFGHSDSAGAKVYANNGTVTLGGDTGNITYYGSAGANTVQSILSNDIFVGGAGHMTINGGSRETITGGTGGLTFNSNGGGANTVTTRAGTTSVLNLSGSDVISSNGTDTVSTVGTLSGTVSGKSTINGGSGDISLVLAGAETFSGQGHDMLSATAGAVITVKDSGFSTVNESGATVSYVQEGPAAAIASVTVSGGSATIHSDSSSGLQVATQAGQSTTVKMGAGPQSVTSLSNDRIYAGTGTGSIAVDGSGADIWGGSGSTTINVNDWNNTDTTTIYASAGSISLNGGADALTFIGGSGSAVVNSGYGSLHVTGGAGSLTIRGGGAPTTFVGGSGAANITLNSTGGSVQFGTGATTVTEAGWGAAVSYTFIAGHTAATDYINNFRAGTDKIIVNGVSATSETISGGSVHFSLSNHIQLILTNVTGPAGQIHIG